MAKLGYTWYPKDWGNSDSVFELTLTERGLYRELIDMAMLCDNKTLISIKTWARKFGSSVVEIESILITLENLKLIEIKDDLLFIPSCEPRLNLVRGGSKGGSAKPNPKPTVKPNESLTQSLPSSKEKRKEKEIQIENIEPTHVHNLVLANPEIPYEKIRNAINNHLGTRHMTYSKQVQLLITNLWANGVNLDDIERVVKNVFNDKWHKDKNFTSCAPHVLFEREFFDRYNFTPPPEAEENKNFGTAYGRW